MNHISFGARGEEIAANYLSNLGYKILHRNYKNSIGELDIIALDGITLVVVEVKTRKNDRYGHAFEAVHESKQRKIKDTTLLFLQEEENRFLECRFDVIEVYPYREKQCNHFIDAFW